MINKLYHYYKKFFLVTPISLFKYNSNRFKVESAKGNCGAFFNLMNYSIKAIYGAFWKRPTILGKALVIRITIILAFLIIKFKLNGYNLFIISEIVSTDNTLFYNFCIIISCLLRVTDLSLLTFLNL